MNTQTAVYAVEGKVIVAHNHPVGTQALTPEQARRMAQALMDKADEAEKIESAGLN